MIALICFRSQNFTVIGHDGYKANGLEPDKKLVVVPVLIQAPSQALLLFVSIQYSCDRVLETAFGLRSKIGSRNGREIKKPIDGNSCCILPVK